VHRPRPTNGVRRNTGAAVGGVLVADARRSLAAIGDPGAPGVGPISFVSPSGSWFRYRPGQFLTLELPVPGRTVWRTYTIASSPSRPLTIAITVKAAAGSIVT